MPEQYGFRRNKGSWVLFSHETNQDIATFKMNKYVNNGQREDQAAKLLRAMNDYDEAIASLRALVDVHRQQDTCGVMPADKGIAYGRAEAVIARAEPCDA